MMAARTPPTLRGELRRDEPMAKHTSWRVGGPARRWYRPADLEDLQVFLAGLPPDETIVWVGLGSNLLVRDGGIPGTVIATQGTLQELNLVPVAQGDAAAGGLVRTEAGVSCAKVARFCTRNDLSGAEFLAGIPGTMGGALAMNAGAFGGETWDWVEAVETIDRSGCLRRRERREYQVGYRSVRGPEQEWFVAALLRLQDGQAAAGQARIKALLDQRGRAQPIGQPSCGSVFRNPQGDHAARLIEAAGLKGECIGGACVADKHANFILNQGTATAADIENLIERIQAVVQQTHGVALQTEVRIVGEART